MLSGPQEEFFKQCCTQFFDEDPLPDYKKEFVREEMASGRLTLDNVSTWLLIRSLTKNRDCRTYSNLRNMGQKKIAVKFAFLDNKAEPAFGFLQDRLLCLDMTLLRVLLNVVSNMQELSLLNLVLRQIDRRNSEVCATLIECLPLFEREDNTNAHLFVLAILTALKDSLSQDKVATTFIAYKDKFKDKCVEFKEILRMMCHNLRNDIVKNVLYDCFCLLPSDPYWQGIIKNELNVETKRFFLGRTIQEGKIAVFKYLFETATVSNETLVYTLVTASKYDKAEYIDIINEYIVRKGIRRVDLFLQSQTHPLFKEEDREMFALLLLTAGLYLNKKMQRLVLAEEHQPPPSIRFSSDISYHSVPNQAQIEPDDALEEINKKKLKPQDVISAKGIA